MTENELWELIEKIAKQNNIEIVDSEPEKVGGYLELDGKLIDTKGLTGKELFCLLLDRSGW